MAKRKTHCPKNHEYNEENSYIDPKGGKHCKLCMRARTREWYHSKEAPRLKQLVKEKQERLLTNYTPPERPESKVEEGFGNWLAGFVDGEGTFIAQIYSNTLSLRFSIKLRADDKEILNTIQQTLQCGKLNFVKRGENRPNDMPAYDFSISSRKDLYNVILPLFDKYPLRAKKKRDYEIWRKIVILMNSQPRIQHRNLVLVLKDKLEPLIKELIEVRKYKELASL